MHQGCGFRKSFDIGMEDSLPLDSGHIQEMDMASGGKKDSVNLMENDPQFPEESSGVITIFQSIYRKQKIFIMNDSNEPLKTSDGIRDLTNNRQIIFMRFTR